MEIVSESLDEWLTTLKPFQRNTIKNLLQNNDGNEEKVAELWLNSFGPINTATYGGVPTSASNKNYFKSLKSELNKLICGDEDYEEEKKQILDGGHLLNVAASAKIASLLAPVIGVYLIS